MYSRNAPYYNTKGTWTIPEDADPRSELEQACDKLSKWQLLNHALGREEDLREVQLADVT